MAKKVVISDMTTIVQRSPSGIMNSKGNSMKRKNWAVTTEASIEPTKEPSRRDERIRLYCSYINTLRP